MDVLFDAVRQTCTLPMQIPGILERGEFQHDLDSNHTDGSGG